MMGSSLCMWCPSLDGDQTVSVSWASVLELCLGALQLPTAGHDACLSLLLQTQFPHWLILTRLVHLVAKELNECTQAPDKGRRRCTKHLRTALLTLCSVCA